MPCQICVFLHVMFLMESVGIWTDHHSDLLQGIRPTAELCPVNSILVTAAVMPAAVPYAIQVRVGTGVVPPASLLIVGTISCMRGNEVWVSKFSILIQHYTVILFRTLQRWRHFWNLESFWFPVGFWIRSVTNNSFLHVSFIKIIFTNEFWNHYTIVRIKKLKLGCKDPQLHDFNMTWLPITLMQNWKFWARIVRKSAVINTRL